MPTRLKDLAKVAIASTMDGNFYVRRVSGTAAKVGETKLSTEGNKHTWIAVRVTETKSIRPKFLYYYVMGLWATHKLAREVRGSLQQFITTRAIKNISMPVEDWPLAKQDKMVTALDSSIETTEAMLLDMQKKLKAAQALWPAILNKAFSLKGKGS
jgi:hypothetical protein